MSMHRSQPKASASGSNAALLKPAESCLFRAYEDIAHSRITAFSNKILQWDQMMYFDGLFGVSFLTQKK